MRWALAVWPIREGGLIAQNPANCQYSRGVPTSPPFQGRPPHILRAHPDPAQRPYTSGGQTPRHSPSVTAARCCWRPHAMGMHPSHTRSLAKSMRPTRPHRHPLPRTRAFGRSQSRSSFNSNYRISTQWTAVRAAAPQTEPQLIQLDRSPGRSPSVRAAAHSIGPQSEEHRQSEQAEFCSPLLLLVST